MNICRIAVFCSTAKLRGAFIAKTADERRHRKHSNHSPSMEYLVQAVEQARNRFFIEKRKKSRAATEQLQCQQCGNNQLKDCSWKLCRRCCRRAGNDCKPHVHSTWAPTRKREANAALLSA